MMKQYNRVCARIDLDAIEYNMEMMHKNTREGVSMISVIKTDGYGHGAVQIARMLEPKDYIWGYAVATLDEAVVLRKRGIKKPIITEITRLPGLIMEGMFTHFAKADETDKTFTNKQYEGYLWMKKRLEENGVTFQYYHCCNSAGIIDVKEANLDLVRAGISTYGLYPSEEVEKENVPLKPALELVSHVAHVKWVDEGTPVSYGGTYITKRRTRIATIPVGYGDGYPRSLSNKGYVLIHGKEAPILGRVCMDQFMVDVTEIEDVAFGDVVTLVGENEGAHLPVEVLSDLSGRFNYEFVCDLGKRIPREFIRHGEVVEQMDYFE